MKILSDILIPAAIAAVTMVGIIGHDSPSYHILSIDSEGFAADTVKYPRAAYKLNRKGNLEDFKLADSLFADNYSLNLALDTIPHLTARDTIKVPDSLRLIDPFRYKYYVAMMDSLTHRIVVDSLVRTSRNWFAAGDSLKGVADSLDWKRIDSVYLADSSAIAKAAFLAWYNSLDRKARRKYDIEQMIPIKLAEMDSLKKAKEKKQEIRDSIIENTPRILETFALPDSMQYKRIIHWTVDQDFHDMKVTEPDTTYNFHYYDYDFQRKDVNATWLGVAGSPVQYYNWFNRDSREGVEFYKAQEAWSYSPSTLKQYNTKTPHTELAYFGTLFAGDQLESDNLHLMTTQNILPALNFTLLYERWGGKGMLENEETTNNNFAAGINWLGKKYMVNAGYIRNTVKRGENGGIEDLSMIRDTTVNAREIKVNMPNASSKISKNTVFLDQQLRIPFSFIEKIKARKDSTYVPDSLLNKDLTSAFVGHSLEFSSYGRAFKEVQKSPVDSLGEKIFDNKLFIRMQPWSSEAIVSKIDVGIGDQLRMYYAPSATDTTTHRENDLYLYAGAKGQYKKYMNWNAKAKYDFAGARAGDLDIRANANFSLYPFRRSPSSPLTLGASFSTSLESPDFYQRNMYTSVYKWNLGDVSKVSTTRIEGSLDIPRWKLDAKVGYALLANNIYYGTDAKAAQSSAATSILSAYLHKDLTLLNHIHLDNRVLLQFSSNEEVMPLPKASFNLRYYYEFVVQRDEERNNVMTMQAGINAFYNTAWNSSAWNPVLGVFHNQNERMYTNGPYFDVFINVQWKRACIFIKYQNAGGGWPMSEHDYFSADRYIVTQNGLKGLKLGVFWPFYKQARENKRVSAD